MADKQLNTFRKIIEDGDKINTSSAASQYLERVSGFLSVAFSQDYLPKYKDLLKSSSSVHDKVGSAVGFLEGLFEKTNAVSSQIEMTSKNGLANEKVNYDWKNVFIVHGRDNEAKEIVARFIQKLDLNPIILHEKPNSGKTIIEKFERFSDVAYAVVLLTPDDLGSLNDTKKKSSSRARQNVILELGYFMGKLGRNNVCALIKNNVELPSDYHGILYVDFDSKGAWKTKLAQEFVQAKMEIKLEGLL